jgi:hypothetical protein
VTRDRALEIIAAYGGDAARWPATEAAALLALADSDAEVAGALVDARRLDALLGDWAGDVAPAVIDIAAITNLPRAAPAVRPTRRWLAGGVFAAAMAAGIAFLAPVTPAGDRSMTNVSTPSAVQLAAAESDSFDSDADAFATVFTPTVDEDALI